LANPEMAEKYRLALLQKWNTWKTEIKSSIKELI
jgi:hypothetical protein